jgi:deazaflavin-dependent oxidoreductase (nitroreductase family)
MHHLHWLKRWSYRDNRPHALARAMNAFWGRQYAAAGPLSRGRDVTLEVRGRSSGKIIAFPVVLADLDGDWYVVSMLGEDANWVRNVRAAGGRAAIRHGGLQPVHLREVPAEQRAPILKRYLEVAPGARPHLPINRNAPVAEFAAICAGFPVFQVEGFNSRRR